LSYLRGLGFSQLRGLEIVPELACIGQQKDIPVALGSVESFDPGFAPHVVVLTEVLEHLPNPVDFLRTVLATMSPHLLLATTPNPERWAVRMGVRRLGDWPPGHLIRWRERSLRTAFERAGFSGIDVIPVFPTGYEIWLQLLNLLTSGGSYSSQRAPRLLRKALHAAIANIDRTVPLVGTMLSPVAAAFRALGLKGRSWLVVARA
jgi:hypothetical protein